MNNTRRFIGIFLILLLLLSSCGGPGRREGNDLNRFTGLFENTSGFIQLILYAAVLEIIFNLDEPPSFVNSNDMDNGDFALSKAYFHQKNKFEYFNIEFDSVYIEFCNNTKIVGNGKIDGIIFLANELRFKNEDIDVSGKINIEFKSPSFQHTIEMAMSKDSLNDELRPLFGSQVDGKRNAIRFGANATFNQFDSFSEMADNATATAYCSMSYSVQKEEKIQNNDSILSLHFVKANDFWKFDSADKNLVELLEDLDND